MLPARIYIYILNRCAKNCQQNNSMSEAWEINVKQTSRFVLLLRHRARIFAIMLRKSQ